ncbi:MAG: hypothetical protein AAB295_08905, partial [Chloroflexota bacterium]
ALVAHFERLVELDAQMPFFAFMISRSDAGERRVHRITGKPRYDAAGRFLGYRGVGQDVTEKRRSERALSEAKERLEFATAGGNLAVWDIDVGNDRIHLGSGWGELLDARRVERSVDLYERIHAADRDAVRAAFLRTLRNTAVQGVEFRLRTAAGDWK